MEQHRVLSRGNGRSSREKYFRSTCKPSFVDQDPRQCEAKRTLDFFSHCSSVEEWANEKDNIMFFKAGRGQRLPKNANGHQLTQKSDRSANTAQFQTIKSARTTIVPKRIVFTEEQIFNSPKIKNCKPNKQNFRVTKRKPNFSKNQPLNVKENNFVQDPTIQMEYIRELMKKRFQENSIHNILKKVAKQKFIVNTSFIRI